MLLHCVEHNISVVSDCVGQNKAVVTALFETEQREKQDRLAVSLVALLYRRRTED